MSDGAAARKPLVIGVLGAECTGKTALAQALAPRLAALTGLRCTWVSEWLRDWCEAQGRTPRADEQAAIAAGQQARIAAACAVHDIVVADTTALMTAVYSHHYFADDSLDARALAQHRDCALTLVTAPDIAWEADGVQRDGPQVRAPVDARIRTLLDQHRLPWQLVQGQGEARVASALAALTPLLVLRGLLRP